RVGRPCRCRREGCFDGRSANRPRPRAATTRPNRLRGARQTRGETIPGNPSAQLRAGWGLEVARLRHELRVGLGTGGLLLIFLLAAVLRFPTLGASGLWLDEVIQAGATRYHSLSEVIAWTRLDDQMPLLNAITWLMRGALPNDVLLRVPSAVAGLLTVAGMYLLGRALFGHRAALIASILTALWPFAASYSREARPYALL